MKIKLVVFLLIMSFTCGYFISQAFTPTVEATPEVEQVIEKAYWTISIVRHEPNPEVIAWLEFCVDRHQYFVDNPEECNVDIGFPKWHQMCVDKYELSLEEVNEQ